GGYSTLDHTLRRKAFVYSGITENPDLLGQNGFSTLASEWDLFAVNDVSGLGWHTMNGSYSWASPISSGSSQVVITPTATGIYSVSSSFGTGCATTNTQQITLVETINVTIDVTNPTITKCYGPQCAKLKAVVTGGKAPYKYEWNTGHTHSVIAVCYNA